MAKKIDWEERRWLTAAMILSGIAANYGMYPSDRKAVDAVYLADCLVKALNDPKHISYCAELYQREETKQETSTHQADTYNTDAQMMEFGL